MREVIFETRVGVLPLISKYRETSLKTRRSQAFFDEFRHTSNECLKLLLKRTSILGENPVKSWQNSAVIFLRFLNTD